MSFNKFQRITEIQLTSNLAFEATEAGLQSSQGYAPAPEAPDSLSVALRRTYESCGYICWGR
jgi:hypothetical protein